MKTLYYSFIALSLCILPPGYAFDGEEEIQKITLSLNATYQQHIGYGYFKTVWDINKTVENVDRWVEHNITYVIYQEARPIEDTWADRKGDCTDKAILKAYMLRYLGLESRVVYGRILEGGTRDLHAWVEYSPKGYFKKWTSIEQRNMWVGRLERIDVLGGISIPI